MKLSYTVYGLQCYLNTPANATFKNYSYIKWIQNNLGLIIWKQNI